MSSKQEPPVSEAYRSPSMVAMKRPLEDNVAGLAEILIIGR